MFSSSKTSRSIRGCPYLEYDYQLGGLSPGLGLEPWLAGPLLSTLSHAFPGFLSNPQAAYASYPTSPTSMGADLLPTSPVSHLGLIMTPQSRPHSTVVTLKIECLGLWSYI